MFEDSCLIVELEGMLMFTLVSGSQFWSAFRLLSLLLHTTVFMSLLLCREAGQWCDLSYCAVLLREDSERCLPSMHIES